MAANKDKITAADIFDQGIKGSYEQFILLNKQAAKSVTDLKREIIKMNNAMKKGGSTLSNRKAVTTATNKQAQATKKLTAETKKLTAAQRASNAASRAGSRGLASFGGGIKGLLGAAGIVGLTQSLIQLGKAIFNTAKQLDSIDLALSKVTDSTFQFARAQDFLAKTSDRLGLNLVKTSKRYTTFLAAAKQSNLTMKETNEIFETFAGVGANLALTSDEMGSIFLALEQMLSKGKVSTEELRRQLGEKLPGAMGLMAEALGVTTGELDKMLRKGEVLSEEALPKFRIAVANAYGIDNITRVETLAAAQERLTLSFQLFVKEVATEGTALNKLFKGTFGILAERMEAITEWFQEVSHFLDADLPKWEKFWIILKDSFGFDDDSDAIIKRGKELEKSRENMEAYIELLRVARLDATANNQEFDSSMFAFMIEDGQVIEEMMPGIIDLIDQYEKKIVKVAKTEDEIEESRDPVKNINKLEKSRREVTAKIEQLLKEEAKKLEKSAKNLREKLQLYPNDAEAKKELDAIEETLRGFYSRLASMARGVEGGFEPVKILKRSGTYTPPEKEKATESYFTKKDDDTTGLQATAANINKSLGLAQEAYGYIADLENAQFERRMEQLEEETNAINEKYDTLERLALGDEELTAKLAIRREEALELQAKKEKKIEYEAAKAKKKQSLIDAALNIALAITSALTAAPPASWIGAGVAAAIGAVQLATIAATPLPAYAEGTDNHPGGLAMLGDGGKNEIALHPDGTVYMSGDTPEVVDMPKGSKVMSDAKDYINQQVIKAIIDTDNKMDEIIVDKITEAVHKGFKSVKINNNNINNNNLDFQMWRHTLLN